MATAKSQIAPKFRLQSLEQEDIAHTRQEKQRALRCLLEQVSTYSDSRKCHSGEAGKRLRAANTAAAEAMLQKETIDETEACKLLSSVTYHCSYSIFEGWLWRSLTPAGLRLLCGCGCGRTGDGYPLQ